MDLITQLATHRLRTRREAYMRGLLLTDAVIWSIQIAVVVVAGAYFTQMLMEFDGYPIELGSLE